MHNLAHLYLQQQAYKLLWPAQSLQRHRTHVCSALQVQICLPITVCCHSGSNMGLTLE